MTNDTLPRGFVVTGAVAYTGFSRTRLYEEVAAGRLRPLKAGRRTIFLREELDALLDSLPPAPIRVRPAAPTNAA